MNNRCELFKLIEELVDEEIGSLIKSGEFTTEVETNKHNCRELSSKSLIISNKISEDMMKWFMNDYFKRMDELIERILFLWK